LSDEQIFEVCKLLRIHFSQLNNIFGVADEQIRVYLLYR